MKQGTPAQWAEIGKAFREKRELLGLSREELATLADVSAATIVNVEKGYFRVAPREQTLQKLAKILDGEPVSKAVAPLPETVPAMLQEARRRCKLTQGDASAFTGYRTSTQKTAESALRWKTLRVDTLENLCETVGLRLVVKVEPNPDFRGV
jgi:DNA-binding XRE family transcriptional regulator